MARQAVLERFNEPYVITTVPLPPPQPQDHDVLVRVLAASYCHTDAVFCSGSMSQDLPRVGCHEFAGEIVSLGKSVSSQLGLAVGTRVGVPGRAYHPCSTCYECVNNGGDHDGYSPYCPKAQNLGLTRDGGFQDYCLVDSRQVVPIPEGLSAVETAPLMCAGLTIWAALHKDEVINARRIAIMGASGGLGHLGVQFAARLGKEILAIDIGDRAINLLSYVVGNLGEDGKRVTVVNAEAESPEVVLSSMLIDGKGTEELAGVDAVILLPEAQAAWDYAVKLVRNHGTIVVVSFPDKGFTVSAKDLVFRDIKVIGSLVGRNQQLREMVSFAAKHRVAAKVRTFALDKLNELVKEYHKGNGGKLVVDMTL